jgi:hypothetical protein
MNLSAVDLVFIPSREFSRARPKNPARDYSIRSDRTKTVLRHRKLRQNGEKKGKLKRIYDLKKIERVASKGKVESKSAEVAGEKRKRLQRRETTDI